MSPYKGAKDGSSEDKVSSDDQAIKIIQVLGIDKVDGNFI